jgi:hexosaminidase
MLDISRDKVPTMDTLCGLIDLLAGLKINQLQLYMEHTFAYAGHETVWRDASPLTVEDLRALDQRCAEVGIDLVPNQNSLGHFHRWLKHEPYRQLAERPEGFEHPFSREPEPFSLCPTDPGSLELLADLFDQLLPSFRSALFNVGLDETMDIGTGRSAAACEELGTVEVYLEFLSEVNRLVRSRGRRMQFWGDIIIKRPELINRLPVDAIALEWGYEAGHPFERHAPRFAASGHAFYVCPGTSSWNSLGGRVHNALHNLAKAATVGHAHGAAGYLITDWGDFGHLQPLPVSYPGFFAGAGFSWNTDAATPDLPLVELLAAHAPELGAGGAQALVELGDAYLRTGATPVNGTVLFWLLRFADGDLGHRRFKDLTMEGLTRAEEHLADVAHRLDGLDDAAPRVRQELSWVCGLLSWTARLGQARLEHGADETSAQLPADVRRALATELEPLIQQHEPVWLGRNRPGGQADSVTWLTHVKDLLT